MYQSKWIKGMEVAKGERECAARYDLRATRVVAYLTNPEMGGKLSLDSTFKRAGRAVVVHQEHSI